MQALTAGSTVFLLSYSSLISYSGSLAPLLSCPRSYTRLSPLFACLETPITLLSCLVPTPVPESLAVLLFFSLLGPTPLHLVSIALKIFK